MIYCWTTELLALRALQKSTLCSSKIFPFASLILPISSLSSESVYVWYGKGTKISAKNPCLYCSAVFQYQINTPGNGSKGKQKGHVSTMGKIFIDRKSVSFQ